MATSANCVYWFISVGRAIAYNMRGPGIESQRGYCINRRHHILYSTITLRMSYKRLLLYWMLVNIGLSSQWRYVEMKRKINPFPLSFLTKIWTPSTWGISNTMNLLKLWFHLYSKDQSAPIISYSYSSPIAPTLFNYKRVLQDCSIDDPKAKSPNCSCPSIENTTSNFLSSLWMTIPENWQSKEKGEVNKKNQRNKEKGG